MADLNTYFTGRVAQHEYAQEFDFEYVPQYITVDGKQIITSYLRHFVTAKVVVQSFRFVGVPRSLAYTTTPTTVTDLGNNSFTVPMKSSITNGSTGTRVMIVEEVSVQRTPLSPHLWEIVVTRKGSRYYVNGTQVLAGPDWMANFV